MKEGFPRMERTPINLRANGRFMLNVAGVLEVKGLAANIYIITVLDIARCGLRVTCPVSVPVGSRVVVTSCHTDIVGEVRNTRAMGVNEFWLDIKADTGADGGLDLTSARLTR
jgi:hypothetical protein